jgi:alkylation response protein AidB-like acyl-CoA dehydrogenase
MPTAAPPRASLLPSLQIGGFSNTSHHEHDAKPLLERIVQHEPAPNESESLSHTIFEGTSEIQQLVISRAISGLRIE